MAQTAALRYTDKGSQIDHTPAGAVTGGDVVLVGSLVCVATEDIAAGAAGSLATDGVFKLPKNSDVFTAGQAVYWDVNGTPVTGDATSGAAGITPSIGRLAGTAIAAAATGDSYVSVLLNVSPLNNIISVQGAPTAKTVANTMTAAELMTGIIAAVPTATGATAAYTLPTGALLDAAASFAVNDSFDWVLINSALAAADTITVTAATGHTIVGNAVVQSLHASTGAIYGYSAQFRTRKTAADTFVTYRIG